LTVIPRATPIFNPPILMPFLAASLFHNAWKWVVPTYHNLNTLRLVERWMGSDWGYGVLFGLLLSCGLGVPLPEDIPLVVAGYFIGNGQMHPAIAGLCAWFGIIGGDCLLYGIGRRYGLEITKVPLIGRHISRERIDRAHVLFEKYGIWVVAVGRLFAGIRGAMVVTAGTIRFKFSHFILADGLAAVVSGGLFMFLGYKVRVWFGSLEHIEILIKHSERRVLLGLIVAVTLFSLWKWWKNKRKQARKRAVIEHAKHVAASTHID
jgi:membrane protein DedA with SNARE-associated domain